MFIKIEAEVISQSKVGLANCPRSSVLDRKEPRCYVLLRAEDGSYTRKNEFCALMYGDNALHVFKPGQKVEVELSFHIIKKNARKHSQVVRVEKISLLEECKCDYLKVKYPWDD